MEGNQFSWKWNLKDIKQDKNIFLDKNFLQQECVFLRI